MENSKRSSNLETTSRAKLILRQFLRFQNSVPLQKNAAATLKRKVQQGAYVIFLDKANDFKKSNFVSAVSLLVAALGINELIGSEERAVIAQYLLIGGIVIFATWLILCYGIRLITGRPVLLKTGRMYLDGGSLFSYHINGFFWKVFVLIFFIALVKWSENRRILDEVSKTRNMIERIHEGDDKLRIRSIVVQEWTWVRQPPSVINQKFRVNAFVSLKADSTRKGGRTFWEERGQVVNEYYDSDFIDEWQYLKRDLDVQVSSDGQRACAWTTTTRRHAKSKELWPDNYSSELWRFERNVIDEDAPWQIVQFSGGLTAQETAPLYKLAVDALVDQKAWLSFDSQQRESARKNPRGTMTKPKKYSTLNQTRAVQQKFFP